MDAVREDMQLVVVRVEDTENRLKRKMMIRVPLSFRNIFAGQINTICESEMTRLLIHWFRIETFSELAVSKCILF